MERHIQLAPGQATLLRQLQTDVVGARTRYELAVAVILAAHPGTTPCHVLRINDDGCTPPTLTIEQQQEGPLPLSLTVS